MCQTGNTTNHNRSRKKFAQKLASWRKTSIRNQSVKIALSATIWYHVVVWVLLSTVDIEILLIKQTWVFAVGMQIGSLHVARTDRSGIGSFYVWKSNGMWDFRDLDGEKSDKKSSWILRHLLFCILFVACAWDTDRCRETKAINRGSIYLHWLVRKEKTNCRKCIIEF